MSKRAGGGSATVTRGICVGYWYKMIFKGIKTYKLEVKVNQINGCNVMTIQSFACFHDSFSQSYERCSHLFMIPTREIFDITANNAFKQKLIDRMMTHHGLSITGLGL